VYQKAQAAQGALAVDAGDDVVGQGHRLLGGGEDEGAGLDDEGLVVLDDDELSEVVPGLADIDVGAAGDAEGPEGAVEVKVDGGGLNGVAVKRDKLRIEGRVNSYAVCRSIIKLPEMRWSALIAATLAVATIACGDSVSLLRLTPTASPTTGSTPTPTPIASPPKLHPIVSGKQVAVEASVVITDAGEKLYVSLSREGFLWRFEPGDRWTVSREDGTIFLSGTVVREALQYEGVYGFVRPDAGPLVAYFFGTDGNWTVYPAEEVCRLSGYYLKSRQDIYPTVLKGLVEVAVICLEELGITEGILETP